MSYRSSICGAVIVLSIMAGHNSAWSEPKKDVAVAASKWEAVFAENNSDSILALYSKDGVLWGTLSPTVRADPPGLRAYFVSAFQALPKATVKFGRSTDPSVWQYGSKYGILNFVIHQNGEPKSIPARYSFTYVKEGENWMIVDHHSSAMPASR